MDPSAPRDLCSGQMSTSQVRLERPDRLTVGTQVNRAVSHVAAFVIVDPQWQVVAIYQGDWMVRCQPVFACQRTELLLTIVVVRPAVYTESELGDGRRRHALGSRGEDE